MSSSAPTAPVGFRPHLRAVVAPGVGTYLLSARGVSLLEGRHIETLAPLLDGTRTLSTILREAALQLPVADAGRLLGQLAKADLIGYQRPGAHDHAAQAYWHLAGLHGGLVAERIADTPVVVMALGQVDAEPVRVACRASGLVVVTEQQPEPRFSLVLCDDYLDPRLREVDSDHRSAGRRWMLAKPSGVDVWVGPVFGSLPAPSSGTQPGGPGACWSCLAHRLQGHRWAEGPAARELGIQGPAPRPEASLAAGRTLGVQLAVLMAAKFLAGSLGGEQEVLTTFDTITFRAGRHPVARRPQCPACGASRLVAEQVRRPIKLMPRHSVSAAGGSPRAQGPEQVLASYRHLVGPITGVVAELRRDSRLPEELSCFVSGRNLAMAAWDLAGVRSGLRSCSGGKGVDALEAEVGALCEAVERYSGTSQGDEPTVRDSLAGLGSRAIHPNACQLFADYQFHERHQWNASHGRMHYVCAPFDPNGLTDWTPVWSVSAGVHRWLPTSMLYFQMGGLPPVAGGRTVDGGRPVDGPRADSNGNAAGSSLEDAIVQGFLELVERDAVALWWYNRTRHPAVDLAAFDEPWLARLRAAYGRLRRDLWVLDLTTDFGIPAMVAVSRRVDKPAEDITLGFGAGFQPAQALQRAVTELSQLLPAVAAAEPDGSGYRAGDPDLMAWWTAATVANQPYLLPDPAESPRTPATFQCPPPRADLRDDVTAIESLVRRHGLELLVLDQTRPDIGMPVVKVIVPGMRHFWARYAPGRLFDVPVSLGRLSRRTRPADLNPIPLFA